jgi:hypothetical protein
LQLAALQRRGEAGGAGWRGGGQARREGLQLNGHLPAAGEQFFGAGGGGRGDGAKYSEKAGKPS